MTKPTALDKALKAYDTEKKWYEEHGGSLAAYVARYGSASDPNHYGSGGEAIHAADKAALDRAEQRAFKALARSSRRMARKAGLA